DGIVPVSTAVPPEPTPSAPTPPTAPRRPHVLVAHGDQRVDDWYWLGDREDPAVTAYLEAENAYADRILEPTRVLQERLFQEIRKRVVETDVSAPSQHGRWWYWTLTEEGKQYRSYWRRADPERTLSAGEVLGEIQASL